ncbi:MAG: DUF1499 domain-containing protein [Myxococcaceae bacterium]
MSLSRARGWPWPLGRWDAAGLGVGAGGRAGSRVDMRSRSRVGRGDMGTNAKRIESFLRSLR